MGEKPTGTSSERHRLVNMIVTHLKTMCGESKHVLLEKFTVTGDYCTSADTPNSEMIDCICK